MYVCILKPFINTIVRRSWGPYPTVEAGSTSASLRNFKICFLVSLNRMNCRPQWDKEKSNETQLRDFRGLGFLVLDYLLESVKIGIGKKALPMLSMCLMLYTVSFVLK